MCIGVAVVDVCLSVQLRDIPRAPTTYPFAVRSRRATWGQRERGESVCALVYALCAWRCSTWGTFYER